MACRFNRKCLVAYRFPNGSGTWWVSAALPRSQYIQLEVEVTRTGFLTEASAHSFQRTRLGTHFWGLGSTLGNPPDGLFDRSKYIRLSSAAAIYPALNL